MGQEPGTISHSATHPNFIQKTMTEHLFLHQRFTELLLGLRMVMGFLGGGGVLVDLGLLNPKP